MKFPEESMIVNYVTAKTVSLVLVVLMVFLIAGCARSGPPAPVDIRGVGAGETRPGRSTMTANEGQGTGSTSATRYGSYGSSSYSTANNTGMSSSAYSPPPGYGHGVRSSAIQTETLGEPDDAYAQSAQSSRPSTPSRTTGSSSPSDAAGSSRHTPAPPTNAPVTASSNHVSSTAATKPQHSEPTTLLPTVPPQSSTPASQIASPNILGDGAYGWPTRGKVLSSYGPQSGGQANDGINIAGNIGDRVYAARAGEVSYAGNEVRHLGNVVLVRHSGGYITVYAHLNEIYVSKGDNVLKGQPLGTVGQTGSVKEPQLHFEIRQNSTPLDPMKYLGK